MDIRSWTPLVEQLRSIGHEDQYFRKATAGQVSKLGYCDSMFFANNSAEEFSEMLIESTAGYMSLGFIVNYGKIDDLQIDLRQYINRI